jgi:hypothetical protein
VRVFDGSTGLQMTGPLGSFFPFDKSFHGGVFVASGDVNADGYDDVIVGSGPGMTATVAVYSGASGTLLKSFNPYGAFQGGAHVAAADFTGDNHADIASGAGPCGGPHVQIFDSVTGHRIFDWMAFNPRFTGGVFVAAGDLTKDGVPDLVVGAGPGGGPQVNVYDGANHFAVAGYQFAYAAGFDGGVRVGVLEAGPVSQILTAAGPGGGPQVNIFDPVKLELLQAFNAYSTNFAGGVFVA